MSVTIYDIAKEAGVSIATVSRVFNNSTNVSEKSRTKILQLAKKMGYHPQAMAQGLARKKSKLISVIVPVISNYFFMEVLEGIQEQIGNSDFDLNIYNIKISDDIFDQVEYSIKRGMAEGYVIISVHLSEREWKALKKFDVPVTLVDEYSAEYDSVSVDSVEGAYNATRYLMENGYERIAMISAISSSKPSQDRISGYRRALEDGGRFLVPELIVTGSSRARDGFTEKNGYEAMISLLELPELPDACFCNSDIQAIGAIKAMQDRGKYLPIIGFDDIQFSDFFGLSTMRQPMREMGEMAIGKLLNRIENPDANVSHTVFSPELVLRSSSISPAAMAEASSLRDDSITGSSVPS
ncbi:MAG: LacI family transcriptional regulator [Candidatus Cyclonatronum sp.]|uniref:LacI family DNA-binding transcriptional regulator n=1 Tax=Cyclonatronum sp. TaxID=3024185 RepID=UPI0025C32332|nr:LacI family DNA-binding transcriptional regulator [Cyclonatronum sp.]MCH8487139.1 LacI family transcriptional regulator [Cyclonatronum sp.]